jgi:hypothetical protein
MVKRQKEALDKAHALTLAISLHSKGSSELSAIAENNPAFVSEWIEELAQWRAQSLKESELFDLVIKALERGRCPAIN